MFTYFKILRSTSSQQQLISTALTAVMILFLFSGCSLPVASQTTVLKTDKGYIRGRMENKVLVFRGVPYAKAPTGNLRFKAPQPADSWTDTLSCETFGSIAAQYNGAEKVTAGEENCLSLNIYAPSPSGTGAPSEGKQKSLTKPKLPVVVWVHGGGMTSGAGKGMDGKAFSGQDSIITITINYRLGVFGFLYLGDQQKDYSSSGNNGLLDCIMALQWIRKNISAFGGDPSQVTVMGESAGAKLVSTLLVAPKAKGYYHQLILESGSVHCIRDSSTAKSIRKRLLDSLGLKKPSDLLSLSTSQLIEAQHKVCSGAQGTNYFGPVQDGKVITSDPYLYIKGHPDPKIRLLIGTNSAESKMFMNSDKRLFHPDDRVLMDWFGNNYHYIKSADRKALAATAELSYETNLFTQYMYQMHSYRLAKALVTHQTPVWVYRFDYSRDHSGANHAQELDYVWFTGSNNAFNKEEVALAQQMHQAWVNFIRGKSPGAINHTQWPSYNNEVRAVQVFDRSSHLETHKNIFDDPNYPSSAIVLK